MSTSLPICLRRPLFLRDARASVAVEFGFIAMACILLILETIQAGLYFYMSGELDKATSRAVRQIMTGTVTNGSLTATQFRTNVLCPALPQMMPCSGVVSNLQPVSEATYPNGFYTFVNPQQTAILTPTMNNNQTSFCPGASGSVVYAQIFYAMPVFSPIWKLVNSASWNGSTVHFIGSAAAFKNEPYPSSQQPPC